MGEVLAMTDEQRDEYRALLVEDVGFTPEQADDCTSGDIDRNGASSMLPGIIETVEEIGIGWFTDDQVIEAGVGVLDATRTGHENWTLTALKLLHRAREAETKIRALAHAHHDNANEHSQELADLAEILSASTMTVAEAEAWRGQTEVEGHNIHPVAAAEAVVEDMLTHGVAFASPASRAALTERLAGVIQGVTRRDVKPVHPFPLWCAFETDPQEELPFHGPHETKEDAVAAGLLLRLETPVEVKARRCRRVRASECATMWWHLEQIVDAIQDEPRGKIEDHGVYVLGGFEVPWARQREGADPSVLDNLIEVDAFEVEPEGATP
jgi:hypothetical protein